MLIDVSTAVGPWPFLDLKGTEPEDLSMEILKKEIDAALVSPNEAVCHKNPHMFNQKHIDRLKPFPNLIPVPVINPLLKDMEDQLKSVHKKGVPAVKIYPNYHGYNPDCEEVVKMINICAEYDLTLMIQTRVMDERGHHPVMLVRDVEMEGILDVIEKGKNVPVVICARNYIYTEEKINRIIERPQTYVETSFMELALNHISTLNQVRCNLNYNYDRLLFGTHYPFFYMQANIVKLDALEDDAYKQVTELNALKAFKRLENILN